jgi:hypothetical protein
MIFCLIYKTTKGVFSQTETNKYSLRYQNAIVRKTVVTLQVIVQAVLDLMIQVDSFSCRLQGTELVLSKGNYIIYLF